MGIDPISHPEQNLSLRQKTESGPERKQFRYPTAELPISKCRKRWQSIGHKGAVAAPD